jgi:hypothetical protein
MTILTSTEIHLRHGFQRHDLKSIHFSPMDETTLCLLRTGLISPEMNRHVTNSEIIPGEARAHEPRADFPG